MEPTPTTNDLPLLRGSFANLTQALEYAAGGRTGYNFYDGAGRLSAVLPYARLRNEARSLARRMLGLGLRRGARVALVGDTHPDFMRIFFACQYAGLVPVPLPPPLQLGARRDYAGTLRRMLEVCGAQIAIASNSFMADRINGTAGLDLSFHGGVAAF